MNHLFDSLAAHPLVSGGLVLGAVGWILALLRSLPGHFFAYARARLITSVEVHDRDPAFQWLDTWLAAHPGAHGQRSFIARCEAVPVGGRPASNVPMPPTTAQVSLGSDYRWQFVFSPAPGSGLVRFREHRIWIERRRRWYETAFNGSPHSDTFILTHLGSMQVIKDLLEEALAQSRKGDDPGISVLVGNGGQWGHQGYKPRRPLESVMLNPGVLNELIVDMERFYSSGNWYRERGIPWQRGYLFAGIPGAGKTSTAVALAGKLDLSIAIVSLASSEMDDQAIARMMLALPPRSLLLIEDIDALFKERESKCRVTFAGLLNTLDGVAAPEGRMLVMTTNHPEHLDRALIRSGRIDRRVDFGFATRDQARRLFLWFFRDADLTTSELDGMAARFATTITAANVGMAAIQEHLVLHRDSPAVAAFTPMALKIAA